MSSLVVHFLNVGHGDCTIVEHPSGRITIIDIHNGEEIDDDSENEILSEFGWSKISLEVAKLLGTSKQQLLEKAGYNIPRTNPIDFLKSEYPQKTVYRYIQTHPDIDHMSGLKALSSSIGIYNFWDTDNTKSMSSFHPFRARTDKDDWDEYQRLRDGNGVNVFQNKRGSVGQYWAKDDHDGPGDAIEILSPTSSLVTDCDGRKDWNNMSYVLRLKHAGRSVILGGDAEETAWKNIVAEYDIALGGVSVLKASHHGRHSGFHEPAVEIMKPALTVLSVGKKPETDAHQDYTKHSDMVWSTRWKGNVTIRIDDHGNVTANSQYNQEKAA